MGPPGKDGLSPAVFENQTEEFIYRFNRYEKYMAAEAALDIDLPQLGNHRLSFMGANVSGSEGIGLGYAYRDENGIALKLGIATAGQSVTVTKLGVSWEF